MKNFIASMFSNRFGILLAALNLCFFASHGFSLMESSAGRLFLFANVPASIMLSLVHSFQTIFFPKMALSTILDLMTFVFAVSIVFQWLFIAWIARVLAQKFRPKTL